MKRMLFTALAMLTVLAVFGSDAEAARRGTHLDKAYARQAAVRSWHGNYYHVEYGRPVALVLPPTAETTTHMSWGVANTRVVPIYHQFGRAYPGQQMVHPRQFRAPPRWPSDTTQFGVYPVRGPW